MLFIRILFRIIFNWLRYIKIFTDKRAIASYIISQKIIKNYSSDYFIKLLFGYGDSETLEIQRILYDFGFYSIITLIAEKYKRKGCGSVYTYIEQEINKLKMK